MQLHKTGHLLMMMFWVLTVCRPVGRWQRFGETIWLHLQSWHLPTGLNGAKTQKNIIIIIITTVKPQSHTGYV
jgi:hypothetical protein